MFQENYDPDRGPFNDPDDPASRALPFLSNYTGTDKVKIVAVAAGDRHTLLLDSAGHGGAGRGMRIPLDGEAPVRARVDILRGDGGVARGVAVGGDRLHDVPGESGM